MDREKIIDKICGVEMYKNLLIKYVALKVKKVIDKIGVRRRVGVGCIS